MARLSDELQEFLNEAAGKTHPDESTALRLHHSVRELGDVIGVLLKAGAKPAELATEVTAAVKELIGLAPNLGPLAKMAANAGADLFVPQAVMQLSKYAGNAQAFVDAEVIPRIDAAIATLEDIRSDFQHAA